MQTTGVIVLCILMVVNIIRTIHGEKIRVVDLTFTLTTSTIYWPGNHDFNFTILYRGQSGSYWYESNYFSTPEHGGTHLDAPAHFYKGKWRTHEIPVERLIGPGVIIDVTSKATADHDYRVQISDLQAWESKYGNIPQGAIVLMNSGWAKRYPIKKEVFGTLNISNPTYFHFPAFHEGTVEWLITNRNISMVGVDTPSVDYGQSKTFPVHQVLGKHNVPGLENIGYLDSIPEKGATIFIGIIKLFDGSGGPVRIIATYDADASSANVIGCINIIRLFSIFTSFFIFGY
ncbi:isatin hydrolase-like isoform X2 [Patella vulgata]|nr:isatin hydrolase-like isoform X2 [Patella vulgata]